MSRDTTKHYDYIVVGLGAMGSAVLFELSRNKNSGQTVLGIDQYQVPHAMGSSYGESRMIRMAHPSGLPIFHQMATRSKEIMSEMVSSQLSRGASIDNGLKAGSLYEQTASLFVSSQVAEGSMLRRLEKDASAREVRHAHLDETDLTQRYPQLRHREGDQAYFEEETGIIAANACLQKRLELAQADESIDIGMNQSLEFFEKQADGKIFVRTTGGKAYTTDQLVLAAGPWLPKMLPLPEGLNLPVYRAVLHWFEVSSDHLAQYSRGTFPLTVMDVGNGGSVLVFPRENESVNVVKVMYFPSLSEGERAGITPNTVNRIVTAADKKAFYEQYVEPNFDGITPRCADASVCQYTVGPKMSFLIDSYPEADNITFISACSRQGFKYSFAIGESVAQRLTGKSPKFNLQAAFGNKSSNSYPSFSSIIVADPRATELEMYGEEITFLKAMLSYAISIFLMAGSFLANGKMLVETGEGGAEASAIVSTWQTVVLGIATGCVLSTGIVMGRAMGAKQFKEAGDVAKAAWVWTAILAAISTILLACSHQILPAMFPDSVGAAHKAADFFQGYAIGVPPTMYLMASPQIAYQVGDWLAPSITALANYVPSVALSYILGLTCDMGAFGVGLGGGIPPWLVFIGLHLRFLSSRYAPLKLKSQDLGKFKKHLLSLFRQGMELALQRMTEWGNLFLIALVASAWDREASNKTLTNSSINASQLAAINPSVQVIVLLSLLSQGFAHAAGMSARSRREVAVSTALQDKDRSVLVFRSNLGMILRITALNIGVNVALGLVTYLARDPLSDFFLVANATNATKELSGTLYGISALGLLVDAPRIVLGGGLRGWGDIVVPSLISLALMTAVGVPGGYGIGESVSPEEQDPWMFGFRDILMAVSAVLIFWRLAWQYNKDASQNAQGVSKSRFHCFRALQDTCCDPMRKRVGDTITPE